MKTRCLSAFIGVHRRPINDFFTASHGRGSELEYLLHRDRVGRRAVLLASGGGANQDGEWARDARGDGNVDLLHAWGGGGFTGVERDEILAVAVLCGDGGVFGDPGGDHREVASGTPKLATV